MLDDARIVRSVQAAAGEDPVRYRRYEIFHDVLAPAIVRAVTADEERRRVETEQARRDAEQARRSDRRRTRRAWNIAGGAISAAVALLIVGIYGLEQTRNARRSQRIAQSLVLALNAQQIEVTDPQLSAQLALRSLGLHVNSQARAVLLTAVAGLGQSFTHDQHPVYTAVYSRVGTLIAAADADGRARIWDLGTGTEASSFSSPGGSALDTVDFSPDDRVVVTAGADGVARVWSVAHGTQLAALRPRRSSSRLLPELTSATFSPTGDELVLASASDTAVVWNPPSARLRPLAASGAVNAVAFSPDGNLIATADAGGAIELWDAATLTRVRTMGADVGELSVSFSPDGRQIVTAGLTGTVRVLGAGVAQLIGPLRGLERAARTLLRSPSVAARETTA
jgi:WD40 repeat protein